MMPDRSAMTSEMEKEKPMVPHYMKTTAGHNMAPDDIDNPHNFYLSKKIYVSLAASFLTWVLYVSRMPEVSPQITDIDQVDLVQLRSLLARRES